MTVELRPYQREVIDAVEREIVAGRRRIMVVAPTGSGKTVIFCEIIKSYVEKYKSALVVSHRREIITQTSTKLHDNGVRHGIILAGVDPRPMERVQVASIQTLHVRAVRSTAMKLPPADLLIIDEGHHCPAVTYSKIIEAYPNVVLIGCTATPCRGDGRGLGGIFEAMVEAPQVATLVAAGHLVKSRVYAPVDPDLRGVRTKGGDYVEHELADRMDRVDLVGDIVCHWHKFGERRRTVVFACSVAHSIHIRDEFVRAGVRAEHIDGATPKPERDAVLARLAAGEIELISNCMVLTEGWDMPSVGCGILARPTKKMGLFRQMVGRVLRPDDGKPDAIILDHSGAVYRHGLPEDHVDWTLDPERRAIAPAHQSRQERTAASLIECTQCSAVRMGGKPCPVCGFMPHRPAEYVPIRDGDLALVENGHAKAVEYSPATRNRWHAMLAHIAMERNYKPGWAAYKFKEKFGKFPTWGYTPTPIEPSPEVLSWVRSRAIAYARRQTA